MHLVAVTPVETDAPRRLVNFDFVEQVIDRGDWGCTLLFHRCRRTLVVDAREGQDPSAERYLNIRETYGRLQELFALW